MGSSCKIEIPDWAGALDCAITVCDVQGNVLYMNKKAVETFARHGNLIGKNLIDCHNPKSWEKIQEMLHTGNSNAYSIHKNGVKKIIYQSVWRQEDGTIGGLVEISMVVPEDMPHYQR